MKPCLKPKKLTQGNFTGTWLLRRGGTWDHVLFRVQARTPVASGTTESLGHRGCVSSILARSLHLPRMEPEWNQLGWVPGKQCAVQEWVVPVVQGWVVPGTDSIVQVES